MTDDTFNHVAVRSLLADAFTGATRREGAIINEDRLGYLRGFARELLTKFNTYSVEAGSMTWPEVVALLVGTALAGETLFCGGVLTDDK